MALGGVHGLLTRPRDDFNLDGPIAFPFASHPPHSSGELGEYNAVLEGDSILERGTAENEDHVVAEREKGKPDPDVQYHRTAHRPAATPHHRTSTLLCSTDDDVRRTPNNVSPWSSRANLLTHPGATQWDMTGLRLADDLVRHEQLCSL